MSPYTRVRSSVIFSLFSLFNPINANNLINEALSILVCYRMNKVQLYSKVYSKGVPNRFQNGREKGVQTDKQTDKQFNMYISRDLSIQTCV